jgi:alkylation response protein AidB-like acyl-CoA dehydrogenase
MPADGLTALRRQVREWADELRPYALALDREPTTVGDLLHLPAVAWSARLQIPARFNPDPLVLDGRRYHLTSVVERTVFCEEVASVDLGMMLALPGASMAGTLVGVLGDDTQQERFYERLRQRPTWTFFALTEPDGGSDAASMRTRAVIGPDTLVLTGAKRYVSNAVRAQLGAVFFRYGDAPFEVGAAIVDRAAAGLRVEPVDTLGVRGAQLGAVTLDRVEVSRDWLLGRHLSAVRRGMWGWLRTFNLLRPTVASMGVGVARAAHAYVLANRRTLTGSERARLDDLDRRVAAVRRLTRRAAEQVDHDPGEGRLASAAKLGAARLAEQSARLALGFFGPGARLAHPLLDKLARDAGALEFMEGTGNVQRLNLATLVTRDARPWT